MTKNEIINKYGIAEYNHRIERHREWSRRRICKEYEKIENYELAKADNFEGWEVHHRLEISINGEEVHTMKSLKRLNMYYNRPYFELIYLKTVDHTALHMAARDTSGPNNPMYGKYGKVPWNKGIACSEETRKKISETLKGHGPWNKGLKMKK